MTTSTIKRSSAARRIMALLASIMLVATLASFAGAGKAQAGNRDFLRADATGQCEWDPVAYWVQRCDVWSQSMQRTIPVQIQPAKNGGNAGLYLLDGLRATDQGNAWLHDVNAAKTYVDSNITLVMPVGGAASFYADWDGPATYDFVNPVTYKWETFLTQELKGYLADNFGVAPNNNSIAGLSMGGTAAIALGGQHRDQFRQVLSFSGFLTTSVPGAQTFMRLAMLDAGNFNINAMYGSMFNPRRFENDPMNQIQNLHGADVYVSAASGIEGPQDAHYLPEHKASGAALEAASNLTTRAWESAARVGGLNPGVDYPATGLHNWEQFGYQLEKTRPRVLDVMNAW